MNADTPGWRRNIRTVHQEITMTGKDFLSFLPQYVWHMEDLVCEPPRLPFTMYRAWHASRRLRCLLSGEGGDEAFGGYQTTEIFFLTRGLKSAFGRQVCASFLASGVRQLVGTNCTVR